MTREPVLTKADYIVRNAAGEFGNTAPVWLTLHEFYRSADPLDSYVLRSTAAGSGTLYKLTFDQVIDLWRQAPTAWYAAQEAPDYAVLFQGEIVQQPYDAGIALLFSTVRKHMKFALAEEELRLSGLAADEFLRVNLDAEDYDWLKYLLEFYPLHAVEFSAYSKRWGTLMKRMCVWEVRLY